MAQNRVSACYHPSTVILIDDNTKYLNKLQSIVDKTYSAVRLFNRPSEALEFIKKQRVKCFLENCVTCGEEDKLDHHNIDIDIHAIHKHAFNPKRFEEISVLIVDYAMPGVNGFDLCSQLKNTPYKKIILTGEADAEIGLEAFNQGIIDKFISKDNSDFSNVINKAIHELQCQYFYEQSIILSNWTKREKGTMIWLDDPVFHQFFTSLIRDNHILEYYLMDTFGSYLLFDEKGKPSWLAVKNEEGMQASLEVAEGADKIFPSHILDSMSKKEKILYLPQGGFSDDPQQCEKSLHPANELRGKALYYYAYIDAKDAYPIRQNDFYSFDAYKENTINK